VRDVPTLFLVADLDTSLLLRGMYEVYEKTTSPKRADHMHFCDQVEQMHELFARCRRRCSISSRRTSGRSRALRRGFGVSVHSRPRGSRPRHRSSPRRSARRFLEDELIARLAAEGVMARLA